MEVLRNGKFVIPIQADTLMRGLRKSQENPRNKHALVECFGFVGRDEILKTLDEITKFDTTEIPDAFPYPQIFISPNYTIVCGESTIWEKSSTGLESKMSGLTVGSTWSAVIFHDYACLSNGIVTVERNAESKEYAVSTLPTFMSVCNFNGQVLIGAPDAGYYS